MADGVESLWENEKSKDMITTYSLVRLSHNRSNLIDISPVLEFVSWSSIPSHVLVLSDTCVKSCYASYLKSLWQRDLDIPLTDLQPFWNDENAN